MRNRIFAIVSVICMAGCSGLPHTGVNKRPMGSGPKGDHLVDSCIYAVRFNLDEATVKEENYLDAMYCFGVMDGVLGANALSSSTGNRPYFCLPMRMKPWVAAKIVVDYGKVRPDLLSLDEVSYAVSAMAAAFPCTRTRAPTASSVY